MRSIHWFRSDLRLRDNRALADAARADAIVPLFVLDPKLLFGAGRSPARLRFLLGCLARLDADLRGRNLRLVVREGEPAEVIAKLCRELGADRLCFNRDYGPYARARDARVRAAAEAEGVEVRSHKDRVVFEASELRTRSGGPYRVYSPFRRSWWQRLADDAQEPIRRCVLPSSMPRVAAGELPRPAELGIEGDETGIPTPGEDAARRRLRSFLERRVGDYARLRDIPAEDGTSRLSPYLHLGVLSIRSCVEEAQIAAASDRARRGGVRAWIDELVWRDFYAAILDENPHVLRGAYRREYDAIAWNEDEEGFRAWCEGRTGYPFVDAGMRQLRATGWMHNRLRMVVASFLTKDLLIDWRRGERYFMERLVDGDPASNDGGWQWTASTGTDAQPWFRIFNPVSQGERFDPDGRFVRRWVPELADVPARFVQRPWDAPGPPCDYPPPIVDHAERRAEALRRYETARRAADR